MHCELARQAAFAADREKDADPTVLPWQCLRERLVHVVEDGEVPAKTRSLELACVRGWVRVY